MAGGLAGLAFVPGGYDTTGNQVENLIANYNKNQGLAALGRYFQSLENQQLPPASLPSDIGGGARSTSSFGPSTFGRGGQSAVNREAAAVNADTWAPTPDYEAGLALAQPSLQNPPAGGPTLGGAPGAPYSAIMGTPAPGVGAGAGPSPQLLEKYREAQAKYPRIPIRGESAGGMQPTPPSPQPGQPTVPGAPTTPGMPTGPAAFSQPPTPGVLPASPAPRRVSRETFGTAAEGPPTFQSLAAAIVKANPGIDPAVLASAVQLASPLMRTDSQMWYRMLQAELRQEALQQQLNIANTRFGVQEAIAEGNRASRERVAEVGAESRKDVARIGSESRERVAGENITSREKIAASGRESREGIAAAGRESREGIAAAGRAERTARSQQSLEAKAQQFERSLAERQRQFDLKYTAAEQKAAAGQASPADIKSVASAIANYQVNPTTAAAYRQRTQIMAEVLKINPDYDQSDFAAKNRAISAFTSGKQAETIRSLGVANDHLKTVEALAKQLNSGDSRVVNSAFNWINKNLLTGEQTPVTNLEAARQIVATEVIKAVVATGGGVAERLQAQMPLSPDAPLQTVLGAIGVYRRLMSGQIAGFKKQYEGIPGKPKDFNEHFGISAADLAPSSSAAPAESKDRFKGFQIIETAPPGP